jgi:hypothetical protein
MDYFEITSEGGTDIIKQTDSKILLFTNNQTTLTNDYNLSVKSFNNDFYFEVFYDGNIIPNGNKIYIVGEQFPDSLYTTKTKISCFYQNKKWVVIFNPTQF